MKKFVVIFAYIVGALTLIEAILIFVFSGGEGFMIGMGVGILLNALFMIGLGWFLHDHEKRLGNTELRINETRQQLVKDCNRVIENVNKASKSNMENVSHDIAAVKEANQKGIRFLVDQNKSLTAELEECKRKIEELTTLIAKKKSKD